ncbi:MAG: hydroxyacid dehydrogenase [Phycisphaerales bacterium]|nr:MAG: hydroxyacid dehydrogenase [Phycisphaerales bacterium]
MKVLIADKFDDSGVAALKEAGLEVMVNPELKDDALTQAIGETDCDVLVVRSTRVQKPMLEASSKLALVIRAGSGYDTIDTATATERNIRVCNCPGMNAVAVAELTLGLMIALDRRIVAQADDLRKGIWNKKEYGKARGLKGRTMGIVGLGRIGAEVAKRAAAFDMKLIYTDIIARPDLEEQYGMSRVPFEQVLAEADFISLHVPGGADTKHLIGAAEMKKMKPTAFLLNCSRGGVIDEKALADAIKAGEIGGGGLDVYEIEPAATDKEFADPVVQVPQVYGTHHVGASTDQAQAAVAEETVRIIKAFADTGEFINCVNPA